MQKFTTGDVLQSVNGGRFFAEVVGENKFKYQLKNAYAWSEDVAWELWVPKYDVDRSYTKISN